MSTPHGTGIMAKTRVLSFAGLGGFRVRLLRCSVRFAVLRRGRGRRRRTGNDDEAPGTARSLLGHVFVLAGLLLWGGEKCMDVSPADLPRTTCSSEKVSNLRRRATKSSSTSWWLGMQPGRPDGLKPSVFPGQGGCRTWVVASGTGMDRGLNDGNCSNTGSSCRVAWLL